MPVDGIYTMSQEEMAAVVEQIRPSLVIPMHYFGAQMIRRFAGLLGEKWRMQASASPSVAFSRLDLPVGTFLVLPPGRG